jgi:hypothetical protein
MPFFQGEDSGSALTMPDAARSIEFGNDLLDAADRDEPEAPEWIHGGYINSSTAEWAYDDRGELVALRETLEPSIVLLVT